MVKIAGALNASILLCTRRCAPSHEFTRYSRFVTRLVSIRVIEDARDGATYASRKDCGRKTLMQKRDNKVLNGRSACLYTAVRALRWPLDCEGHKLGGVSESPGALESSIFEGYLEDQAGRFWHRCAWMIPSLTIHNGDRWTRVGPCSADLLSSKTSHFPCAHEMAKLGIVMLSFCWQTLWSDPKTYTLQRPLIYSTCIWFAAISDIW